MHGEGTAVSNALSLAETVGGNNERTRNSVKWLKKIWQKAFAVDMEKGQVEMVVEDLKRLVHRHPLDELVSIELIYAYGSLSIEELEELRAFYDLVDENELQGCQMSEGDFVVVRRMTWKGHPHSYSVTGVGPNFYHQRDYFELKNDNWPSMFANFSGRRVEYENGKIPIYDKHDTVTKYVELDARLKNEIEKITTANNA